MIVDSEQKFDKTLSSGGKDTLMQEFIQPWPKGVRAIMLLDLDAFFASVEQLDHPDWRNKPVIVGGRPEDRGVVATASYEARVYGVHSAMASAQAMKLCPQAIWTTGHYDRYRELSARIMDIIHATTPFVQQVSIDEAFADITPSAAFPLHPALVARDIQTQVFQLGVTCSIGVSSAKGIAKIASEVDKPRGITVVYPGTEQAFCNRLPVRALSGVGHATEERLKAHGFASLGDVYRASEEYLVSVLGKPGSTLFARLHGLEPVDYHEQQPKSVSHDYTFPQDITSFEEATQNMLTILAEATRRLRKTGLYATVLSVRVAWSACNSRQEQTTLRQPLADEYSLKAPACTLLRDLWVDGLGVRLISVGLSGLVRPEEAQTGLFPEDDAQALSAARPVPRHAFELVEAQDSINQRFGRGSIAAGRTWVRRSPNPAGHDAGASAGTQSSTAFPTKGQD